MFVKELKRESFRQKVLDCYDQYLNISDKQMIAIGIYVDGKYFTFGNGISHNHMYDIGSISKTMTAHLVLKLVELGKISLNDTVDKYIKLRKGNYPTIDELLTHSAGYNNLTPLEITIPNLIKNGYSKRNVYENLDSATVVKLLERRTCKHIRKYGYSDFAYAVLAVVSENVTCIKFSSLLGDFINEELSLKESVITLADKRQPLSVKNGKVLPFWRWNLDNPYIASGGVVSNIYDMLKYISMQIESQKKYITSAHEICNDVITKNNIKICKGWHTYSKSNQLWHVGGVGTFRSSIIVNKRCKTGVVVLGNTKGISGANVHYLAKMLYSELKIRKIKL